MDEAPITEPEAAPTPRRSRRSQIARGVGRRIAIALVAVAALLLAALLVLDSSLGHRLVVDRIAAITPGSGLRIEIGRIDGSIYGTSNLRDIRVSDPEGVFMTVPEAELDWRPLSWLKSGLDVKLLALHRGVLRRAPRLRPSEDKNAPILPDFDIVVDKLVIDNLTVSEAMAGQRRRADVVANADIRGGHAIVNVNGRFGGGGGGTDVVVFKLDSEPDRDKFDLHLVYDSPKNGVIAKLAGAESNIRARVFGAGGWKHWDGLAYATQDGQRLAAFQLGNRSGNYRLAGQAYPGKMLTGISGQAVGRALSVLYDGTFADNAFNGQLRTAGDAFKAAATGRLDLVDNRAEDLKVKVRVTRPERLLPAFQMAGVALDATVDGPIRNLTIDHVATVARLKAGAVDAQGLRTAGTATWDGERLVLPLAITAQKVTTGNPMIDPRFPGGRLTGDLVLARNKLTSDNLSLAIKGLAAQLSLRGDIARGGYALAGPVAARGFAVENLGTVDGNAKIVFKIGNGVPWTLQANVAGRMTRISNATLQTLTGGNVRFAGGVTLGERIPVIFRKATIRSNKLQMALDGRVQPGGMASLTGRGRHSEYGAFTVEAAMTGQGPNAVLVFDSPLPAAGLKNVRVALSPIEDGFRIETGGDSRLGPFAGTLGLFMPPRGPTRIDIQTFKVWETSITGGVTLGDAGVAGQLLINGGGLDGTVALAPRDGGQSFDANITARNAKFGGAQPLSIGNAKIDATGLIKDGHSTIEGTMLAEGIGMGKVFIGRLAASAYLQDGSGSVTASVSGRRGTRFALQGTAAFAPDQIVAFVSGEYAGRSVSMPRRAVLTRDGEGWKLAPTQIGFGRGIVIAEGHVLGGPTQLRVLLSQMPLSVVDIVIADLGLGGVASGIVDYTNDGQGAPSGNVALMVKGLSRSGLVLTSRPVDLALVARLNPDAVQTRAVIREGGDILGRLQARIGGLPKGGGVMDRLSAGQLAGQLRYSGPAEALWRLSGVEVFDLTGPLGVRADIGGTITAPVIQGAVSSKGLRIQSTLTGTDLRQIEMAGTFRDSTLSLARFSGTTPNGGKVSGSGKIGLADLSTRGPSIDLRIAARNAALVNRDDMGATVTGPLRIVSDGVGGTIAGRVSIDTARWALGQASAVAELPRIKTREINTPADAAPARVPAAPWRFLIDASGANRINVRGLGLDSEWGADLRIRGTTAAPQIFGQVDLVRGGYEFAGKRFELTRGRIRFTGEVPIDPLLDIVAEGDANNISAKITISGSGTKPVIGFSSTPALPEEELLSRLLFGSSITQISAPEAVQLASALASLRGGGGLDPINKLRAAIGLDRLRIVGADPTIGAGTSIAVGKYIGRRFFVELVTDGGGYSATSVEFRITRWLALLATVSTIGDESLNLKVSKDY